MRSARIFYLLLSLLQFIFFLKLIEYVRGEVIQSRQDSFQIDYKGEQVNLTSEDVEEGRAKFIAPRIKRKKLKPWIIGERSDVPQTTKSPIIKQANLLKASDTLASLQGDGRFCPACQNNECPSTKPISAGFPIVPFVIAVLTGVAWFILFLIVWYFHVRDEKSVGGGIGGYGDGGYDSPKPVYGPVHDDDDKSSVFDHFLKPHERSIKPYGRTLHLVLDSISKLADMYNNMEETFL